MLTFFRRIRKTLFGGDSTDESPIFGDLTASSSKYFLYAIGEITLVVIGILIALQINNWNEYRKNRLIEKEVLLEIRDDLEETLYDDLVEDLELHHELLRSTQISLEALLNDWPFHDSLLYHILNCFDDTRTYYKSGGYQTLLSRGIHLITNDSLRKLITDLYQLGFTRLDESAKEYEHQKELDPYFKRHFHLTSDIRWSSAAWYLSDSAYAHLPQLTSYEELKTDREFILELEESMLFRRRKIRRGSFAQRAIEDILNLIDQEIGAEKEKM